MNAQTLIPDATADLVRKPVRKNSYFEVLFGISATWYIAGAYLDAWAHNNIPQLETFWTPWHGVLYSGVMATFLVIAGTMLFNRRMGAATWYEAVPFGYVPAILGAVGMLVGGVGDAIWHTLFGIEKNIDGTLSPTHIWMIICTCLIALGPLRSLYHRDFMIKSWSANLRLAYTVVLFYAMLMLVTQETHPFDLYELPLRASNGMDYLQLLAIVGMVLQTCLLSGLALYLARRWQLRFGLFTIVLTIVGIALAQMRQFEIGIPVSLVAGLAIDAAYLLIKPRLTEPLTMRAFAVCAALPLPAFYLLGVRLAYGPLVWSIHLIIGSVVVCGIFGWLLSYVMVPGQIQQGSPQVPESPQA